MDRTKLYPHQDEQLDAALAILKRSNKLLIQMPPSAGKTMITTAVCRLAFRKVPKVLWIAPETVLVEQAKEEVPLNLERIGCLKTDIDLTVMTRQALAKSLQRGFATKFDILVCDEIHAGTAGNTAAHLEYSKILKAANFANKIMLSATPWQLDGKLVTEADLSNNIIKLSMCAAANKKIIHNVVLKRIDTGIQSTLRNLRTNGLIEVDEDVVEDAKSRYVEYKIPGLSKEDRTKFEVAQVSAVLDVYMQSEIKDGVIPPTLIFCNSVNKGADSIAEVARIIKKRFEVAGLSPLVKELHGTLKDSKQVVKDFKRGKGLNKIDILVVCDMCRAGFDYPALDVVIDFGMNPVNARDTVQKIGRLYRRNVTKKGPSRYYYSRSLHKVLPINGVSKQLTEEMIRELDVEGASQDEIDNRHAAIMEIGAMYANSGEVVAGEKISAAFGLTETFDTGSDEQTEAQEVLQAIADSLGDSKPGRTRLTSVELFVDQVSDKAGKTLEIDIYKTFETPRGAVDPAGNKQAIIEIALSGGPRPTKNHPYIGQTLVAYTNTSHNTYDLKFSEYIRNLRPDWFDSTAKVKKEKLLKMANQGEPRPKFGTKLATALNSYIVSVSSNYDETFTKKIKEFAPKWFDSNRKAENIEKLLNLAKDLSCGRPMQRKHPLGKKLSSYTQKKNKVYDNEFDLLIRSLRPDWFQDKYLIQEQKKQDILNLAKSGQSRPGRESELGPSLSSYVCATARGYDEEFTHKLKKIRPDWFIDYSSNIRKQELIQAAKKGNPKPSNGSKLGNSLAKYITKKSDTYDEVFSNEIRKLRPDWFRKTRNTP